MIRKQQKRLSVLLCMVLLTGLLAIPAAAAEPTETVTDELVYVLSAADGSVNRILVSDWTSGEDTDTITNVEQTGKDRLPIAMEVHYKLNGKTVTAQELTGKSGKLTMRIDYRNLQSEKVNVNGRNREMYVPMAAITGILLDPAVFSHVEVTNAKLLNDGSRSVVIGLALPGLQHNLDISKRDLELPEYIELTADVKDFSLAETFTLVTNEPFSNLDADSPDFVAELKSSVSKMGDATQQLIDGSSQLSEGLRELLQKSGELADGVQALSDGAQQVKSGASELASGAQALSDGANTLFDGLNTLNSKSDSLVGGAQQVFQTLLNAANQQLAASGVAAPQLSMGNYADVLSGLIAGLDEQAVYQQALDQVTAGVEAKRPEIEAAVTAAVQEQVAVQVTAAVRQNVQEQVTAGVREVVAEQVIAVATGGTMNKAQYDAAVEAGQIPEELQMQVEAALEEQMLSEPVIAQIGALVEEKMASEEVQSIIAGKTAEQMGTEAIAQTIHDQTEVQVQKAIADTMASPEVQSQLAAAAEGAKSLIALKTSLDSYNAFYGGVVQYTKGVNSAMQGAQQLSDGAASLKDGTAKMYGATGTLADGIGHLRSSTPALISGVTGLKEGEETLLNGLQQFYNEGITKLSNAVNQDVDGFVGRMRATVKLAQNYRAFCELHEGETYQANFIYRTDAVG